MGSLDVARSSKKTKTISPQESFIDQLHAEDFGFRGGLLVADDLPLLGDYHLITTIEELEAIVPILQGADMRAFDTEFVTPRGTLFDPNIQIKVSPHHPRGVFTGISLAALKDGHVTAWYVNTGHQKGQRVSLEDLRRVLGPLMASLEWSGHPVKVDSHVLRRYNIIDAPVTIGIDTLLSATLLGIKDKSLKELSVADLGWETIEFKDLGRYSLKPKKNGDAQTMQSRDLIYLPPERVMRYAAHDAAQTVALAKLYEPRLQPFYQLYTDIVRPISYVLEDMERAGFLIDVAHFQQLEKDLSVKQEAAAKKILEKFPNTVFTQDGIRDLLYKELQLPVLQETEHGLPSVDAAALGEILEALEDQDHPAIEIIKTISEWNDAEKIRSTFILSKYALLPHPSNPNWAYIITNYNQHVARTGRLSSSDPMNAQNIPVRSGPEVRRGVICEADEIIMVVDQSQMEPRCMAFYLAQAGDETLRDSFRNGIDYYITLGQFALAAIIDIATKLGVKQRKSAKVFALAGAYGASAMGLVHRPELKFLEPTVEKVQAWLDNLFEKIPGLQAYHLAQVWRSIRDGYVQTPWGRRRPIPDISHPDRRLRSKARREAINAPIQAMNADIMQATMLWADMLVKKYNLQKRMVLFAQVHDETDWRVKRHSIMLAAGLLQHCYRNVVDIGVPIDCDVELGENWGDIVALDKFDLPPQLEDTEELLAQIRQEVSPFTDFPMRDIGTVPQLKDIPEELWDECLKAAEDMGIPVDDPALPELSRGSSIEGYCIWAAERQSQKTERVYYSGTLCVRGGYIQLYANEPGHIREGMIRVYGSWGRNGSSFDVKAAMILTGDQLIASLRAAKPLEIDGVTVRCDAIHQLIRDRHANSPGGWR